MVEAVGDSGSDTPVVTCLGGSWYGLLRGGPLTVPDAIAEMLSRVPDPLAMLESLFRVAPVALQVFDASGRCVVANAALVSLFGARPPDGYNIFRDQQAEVQGVTALIRRAFAGEQITLPAAWYDPRANGHADVPHGRRAAVELTLFPLANAHGDVPYVGLSYKDVTAEMELREARRAQAEVQRLELENRQMAEAARARSAVLAQVSHELRTPLNAIIGFTELLQDGVVAPDSAHHHELLAHIAAGGRQLLGLIEDVLEVALIESGKVTLRVERVALRGLIDEVCATVRQARQLAASGVAVDVQCTLETVMLDRSRLKQVLYNFLVFALSRTPAGERVVARAWPLDAHTFRIEVEHGGESLSAADTARLFDDFADRPWGKAHVAGEQGLGLALSRRLVEVQRGTVGVLLGPSTRTIYAELPRALDDA